MLENVDPIVWIVVAVVIAILVVALIVSSVKKRKRTERLRDRFGPEYDRTVQREGSRTKGERELVERENRRERMSLTPLSAERRRELLGRWEELQAAFVDGPESAVRAADVLLDDAARERGYPDADPDQRLRDLAVDHSDEVERYRQAGPEHGDRKGKHGKQDDAESLRRRMLAARGLFEAMVGPDTDDGRDHREVHAPDAPFERVLDDDRRTGAGTPADAGDRRDTSARDDVGQEGATRADLARDRRDTGDDITGDRSDRSDRSDRAENENGPRTRPVETQAGPTSDRHVTREEPLASQPPRSDEHVITPPAPPDPDGDRGSFPSEPR